MTLPRVLAEVWPQQRQRLAGYAHLLVTAWTTDAIDKVEEFQPRACNARLRHVDKLALIARRHGRWMHIYTSDDDAAVWARVALQAEPVPNPNVPGQIGLDDPAPVLTALPDAGRRRKKS